MRLFIYFWFLLASFMLCVSLLPSATSKVQATPLSAALFLFFFYSHFFFLFHPLEDIPWRPLDFGSVFGINYQAKMETLLQGIRILARPIQTISGKVSIPKLRNK